MVPKPNVLSTHVTATAQKLMIILYEVLKQFLSKMVSDHVYITWHCTHHHGNRGTHTYRRQFYLCKQTLTCPTSDGLTTAAATASWSAIPTRRRGWAGKSKLHKSFDDIVWTDDSPFNWRTTGCFFPARLALRQREKLGQRAHSRSWCGLGL